MLRYALEHGESEANVIKGCFASKQPLPQFVKDAPELFFGLEVYIDSFWKLSRDRSSGMGPGPIPYSSLLNFAENLDLLEEDVEDFCYLLMEMDTEFLAYASEKAEADRKRASSKKR